MSILNFTVPSVQPAVIQPPAVTPPAVIPPALAITFIDDTAGGVLMTTAGNTVTIKDATVIPPPPPPPAITSVVVSGPTSFLEGGTGTFSAAVQGTGAFSAAVTWTASAGSISSAGLFTAPNAVENVVITATSVQDVTKSASVTVGVTLGVTGPAVGISPASVSFGNQTVGTTSAVQYVTMTNTGNANLTFSAGFTSTGDFVLAGAGKAHSNTPYAPGASSTVGIAFTPTVAGTRTGTVTLTDNAGNSPQIIQLTGVGVAPAAPTLVSIAVTPSSPSIAVGATDQFTATGTYSDGSTKNITSSVTWASSNTAVATISAAGLSTGLTQGTTSISALLSSVSAQATLTV